MGILGKEGNILELVIVRYFIEEGVFYLIWGEGSFGGSGISIV